MDFNNILKRISSNGVCVCGTDTGVGKTWVSGALTYWLKTQGISAVAFKPMQTGSSELMAHELDSAQLKQMSDDNSAEQEICPYTYEPPVAPWIAQKRIGMNVSLEDLLAVAERRRGSGTERVLVLEGAGGIAVPFTTTLHDGTETFAGITDLCRLLKLPMVVVSRASLGTVNHTVLTIEYARQQSCEVLGVIMNGRDDEPQLFIDENIEMIERATGVPVLSVMPRASDAMSYRSIFAAEINRLGKINGGF